MRSRQVAGTDSLRRILGVAGVAFVGIVSTFVSTAVLGFVHPTALGHDVNSGSHPLDATAELHCLALNIYHEARSETDEGKFAVAQVTLNRVRSPRYPDSICKVVWQRKQFSWTHDGRPDRPRNLDAWKVALRVATTSNDFNRPGIVDRATHYHAVYVQPSWAAVYRPVRRIGKHIFYEPSQRS
jgi:spore germination cell wall hydrolase CwlJ-like protein